MKIFGSAIKRTLAGLLGVWCIIGPVVVVYGALQPEYSMEVLILISILVCAGYVCIAWLWWRNGFASIKSVILDTLLSVCFSILAGIPIGLWNAFTGVRLPGFTGIAFVVGCFCLLETRRARKKALVA